MKKENDFDDFPVSSATDCTGLIPAAPETEEEYESYEELSHFLPPNVPKTKKEDA